MTYCIPYTNANIIYNVDQFLFLIINFIDFFKMLQKQIWHSSQLASSTANFS